MKRSKLLAAISLAVILSILALALPAVPAMAASLSVNPAFGPPGRTVTITGGGYAPGSVNITFQIGLSKTVTNVLSATVASDGSFITTYTIPTQQGGSYNFSTNAFPSVIFPFNITSDLSLSTTIARVGDPVNVGGRGFLADDAIRVYFDGNVVVLPISDANGNFNGTFALPEVAYGNHAIYAEDHLSPSPNYIISITPKLTVDHTTSAAGSTIKASGTGFTSFSTVTFTIDGVTLGNVATASNVGSFSNVELTVPVVAAGSHSLKAGDNNGRSDTITIITAQAMTISPSSGAAGTQIGITGGGFAANKTVTVTWEGEPVTTNPSVVTSDANGNFSAAVVAPKTASGMYDVEVSDGTNNSTAQFTLTATARVDQTTGGVGSSVPFSGDGFNASATITVQYDGVGIGTAKTDAAGSFSGNLIVPPSMAGRHKITITDGVNSVTSDFVTTAAAQISGPEGSGMQATGYVGSDLTVKGNAFVPGATVTIMYDSIAVATVKADGDGSFTAAFKAPASKGGVHIVIASDGTNRVNLSFMMDSTSPLPPTLVSPVKNANASELPGLQWSPVTDPSGVIYTLQIASDSGFNSIVVQKTGLTAPNYQLTEQEKLNPTGGSNPYYWRVMTIDGAFNESPWSTALTFTVGFQFPTWLYYFLIVVGAVIVFAAGFLLGRRTIRNKVQT
jgi:hypothetical protein